VSNPLATRTTLELLQNLKTAVERCAAREKALDEELRVRTAKERLRCEKALEQLNQGLAGDLAEVQLSYETAVTSAQARYESRKARIGKAYQFARAAALRAVDDQAGAHKYELQKRVLQAERERDAALAAATVAFEEFRKNLAAEQETLARQESEAQQAFRGYKSLQKAFLAAYEKCEVDLSREEGRLLDDLRDRVGLAGADLKRLRGVWLAGVFRFTPLWVVLALLELPLLPQLSRAGVNLFTFHWQGSLPMPDAGLIGAVAGSLAVVFAARFLGLSQAAPVAASLSKNLSQGRRLYDACIEKSEARRQRENERIKTEFESTTRQADQELKRALANAGELRVSRRMESDERTVVINNRHEQMHRNRQARIEQQRAEKTDRLKKSVEVRARALRQEEQAVQQRCAAEHEAGWRALEAEWKSALGPLYQAIQAANDTADRLFPGWDDPIWKGWTPPAVFAQSARFARLHIDLQKFCEAAPKDKRLALPGTEKFSVPLCLAIPEQGAILFETAATGQAAAIATLNNLILRLLSTAPAGRLNFTIIDPVGLGQNFAGVMHLADYEEQLINSRIWTQSGQIEQKLADLNEYMEKVIQMYLRNEYATIAEYNEQAGVIAEKYHFLVVADFPAAFTDVAAKRLLSIAASGARCGVYTLIHWDHRQPLPADFIPDELRKSSICLSAKGQDFILTGQSLPGADLVLDAAPASAMAIELIHAIGRASRDSSRVEVPFSHVAPSADQMWTEDTTRELRVPVGRTGATKLQYLAIGKGTCQHGLVAGKTGSGKSTLFHVMITNLALWCSPEQVEFYLVDFKKGVEFKCYGTRRLPHARVVAIESDREFGLSVLQRVDEELRRRGDLFRKLGVQDVPGYKKAGGKEPMPRSLLLIDEFQEFFVEDDKIAQTASLLLDRIVRQGRAFGIHVLLGSQTLGGAYSVARTTLGQMVIRIALQCNEADAYLIMDDTNPAPRLLNRPGEGIYNDMAGALEGNSPFQVVWLPDEERDKSLAAVRARADQSGRAYPGPIVFEGNAPADVRENQLLADLLEADSFKPVTSAHMWLGAPNSIKGPTEAVFQRQSGNNLLVVGQREEATLAMLTVSLVSLAAQYPAGAARVILLDVSPPGSAERDYLERVLKAIPQPYELVRPGQVADVMADLDAERKRRAEDPNSESAPPVFLFIHELQKFSRLRYEEDFSFSSGDDSGAVNPAAVLNSLLSEGARLGFHIVATCDGYNNASRYVSRKALSEFELRVLFQMSANDSASLIDNPRASLLGLHRALLSNAQEGYLETFRPYALPEPEWLEKVAVALAKKAKG
jgi:hypothetical protein